MNEVQIFNFEDNQVRAIEIEGEPWFVGNDVATVLGYSNTRDAIGKHVDGEDKNTVAIRDGITRGNPNKTIINESGLYSLILSSKLPSAKKFKRWVTSEVIPTIRKHGAYMTDQKAFDIVHNKSGLIDLLQQAADQLREKNIQIEEMRPKALFADSVSSSSSTISVGDLAKIIKQNGINIGSIRLFAWLRDNGYLIKRQGSDYNSPTQYSMERGWFEVKETTVNYPDGRTIVKKTPKVTGKGQQYFVNRFLKMEENKEN
ncbi:prophage antirepressor [Lactobacillus phage phiLdb]|uniref:Prophage antirepressor n=1 Tax=Lactobacillus phage phiLdb TaxID=1399942 RepID=U3PCU6_9CAUD|nr:anti-repressor [Lactobacillus phage phiLdb]AGW43718.1 prophage antirepressor [Lactobacillus phage phiLdb]